MDIKNEFFVIFSTEFGNRFVCHRYRYILIWVLREQRLSVATMSAQCILIDCYKEI